MAEEHNVEVNVEQIMEEIREQIRREEEMKEIPAFESIPIREEVSAAEQDTQSDLSKMEDSLRYLNVSYDVPYYWSFGPAGLKTFLKRVVRKLAKCLIPPILEKQNHFNAHVVNCLNIVKALLAHMDAQKTEVALIKEEVSKQAKILQEMLEQSAFVQRLDGIEEQIKLFQEEVAEQTKSMREVIDQSASIQWVNSIKEQIDGMSHDQKEVTVQQRESLQRLGSLEEQMGRLHQRVESLDRQSDAFSASAAKMLLKYRRNENVAVKRDIIDTQGKQKRVDDNESVYKILDYFKFQNDFRGTRSVISERQKIYLPYFKDSVDPIVDIGCGRGEFLKLMKDNRIPAFGIDLYPEYEVEGELNGLDIRQGNGIEFLKSCDLRLGGIFVAQVIEHISFLELQELCLAAYEKLAPDAYLVLETPNPTCLSMFTSSFYIDPTHNKPVHPLLLEYLLKEIGFAEVRTVFTETSRTDVVLPMIESNAINNLEEVNQAIKRVSNFLYGSLDYAVIAKK